MKGTKISDTIARKKKYRLYVAEKITKTCKEVEGERKRKKRIRVDVSMMNETFAGSQKQKRWVIWWKNGCNG